jgi:hypothetical protein
MRSSPRLDPVLVEAVRRTDVERLSSAEVWREAGELADRLGIARPGYHSVLAIVRAERSRRVERRAALVEAVDELWDYTGIDYATLARHLVDTRRR